MGQNVHIRTGPPTRPLGTRTHQHRLRTSTSSKFISFWIIGIITLVLLQTSTAIPVPDDSGAVTPELTDVTEDPGVPVNDVETPVSEVDDNTEENITDAPPDHDPTEAAEEADDEEQDEEVTPAIIEETETLVPELDPQDDKSISDEQFENMKEILSNHPGLPKDIDFNKLNGKYIHFSQEKDGDGHIIIRIPSKDRTGSEDEEDVVEGGWNQIEDEEGDGDVNDDFYVFKNTRAPGPDTWQDQKTTTPTPPEEDVPEEETDDSIADGWPPKPHSTTVANNPTTVPIVESTTAKQTTTAAAESTTVQVITTIPSKTPTTPQPTTVAEIAPTTTPQNNEIVPPPMTPKNTRKNKIETSSTSQAEDQIEPNDPAETAAGWFKNENGEWSWLAILFVMFLLFI